MKGRQRRPRVVWPLPGLRGRRAQRPATIDDTDAGLLRLDDKALRYAIAREGDHIARLEREHLLVTAETGAVAEFAIEPEADLLDIMLLSPGGRHAVEGCVTRGLEIRSGRDR